MPHAIIAASAGGASAPILGADTAVLILLVAGLLFLAKTVFALRREVEALKKAQRAAAPASPPQKSPPAAPAPAPAAHVEGGPPPEVRAAIAAAINVVLGNGVRVVSISNTSVLLWSQEGRRQVFQSHKVR